MTWTLAFLIVACWCIGCFAFGFFRQMGKSVKSERGKVWAEPICTSGIHFFVTINTQAGPQIAEGQIKTTYVLKRCAFCGIHSTPCFQDEWTLGDFTAKESEIAQLEAIGKL